MNSHITTVEDSCEPSRLSSARNTQQVRRWLSFFMAALLFSGITAIPVNWELTTLLRFTPQHSSLHLWLTKVLNAYQEVNERLPFLLYGYDWLAFAHIILAILFIGPYRDPVKNIWVIEFGMIACLLILPLAFTAGYFRGIPLGWQLIDCSFGVVGMVPLWIVHKKIRAIEKIQQAPPVDRQGSIVDPGESSAQHHPKTMRAPDDSFSRRTSRFSPSVHHLSRTIHLN